MRRRVYGSPFHIDWNSEIAVIAYARRLGRGQTVFKVPGRSNYNITHTSRTDQYQPDWVVYLT